MRMGALVHSRAGIGGTRIQREHKSGNSNQEPKDPSVHRSRRIYFAPILTRKDGQQANKKPAGSLRKRLYTEALNEPPG